MSDSEDDLYDEEEVQLRKKLTGAQFLNFKKKIKRNSIQFNDREIALMFDSLGKIDALT